ncbi:MAG: class I SAM-dependent methyltransferase [Acidimicrobiales bacterium]|nr:class I SAM-dependent methyltransferase [Acidimicrobiales bacterium]
MMAPQEHWDTIYQTRPTEDLGWYQPSPSTLDLVLRYSTPTDPVIDIGGGDSHMVDELVAAGYQDVTVLDLSVAALERSRTRLGEAAGNVAWIRADITDWEPTSTWSLWHDRAVFHFLVDPDDQRRYVETARRAIAPGGHLVMATFAPDGPEQCAGLPVQRYDAKALADVFGSGFRLVEHAEMSGQAVEVGDRRPYVVVVLQRR